MITQGEVLDIASQAIYTIIMVSAPLLLVSLITDPYVCAEDSCRVCRNDDFWFLDADTANRVYYRFVVEFRRILKLSGYGKFEFFFSYI